MSFGHIVTTVVALFSFIYWAMKQESRLTKLEDQSVIAQHADAEQNTERKQLRQEIRDELKEIRTILDVMRGRR